MHLGARPSVPRSLEDPLASHHANATGTLAGARGVRRHGVAHVVVASSSSVYGANPDAAQARGPHADAVSPYAVSKLATEAYALAHAACFGFGALAFRFFNVFGPLQAAGHAYAAVVPAFVAAALAGEPVTVHGDGEQTRDFTYVGSVCEVITDAVAAGRHQRPTGEPRLRRPLVAARAARRSSRRCSATRSSDGTSSPAPATCATARPTRPSCARCFPRSSRSRSTTGSAAPSSGSERGS